MEESIPHYKVVKQMPFCPQCRVELTFKMATNVGFDMFVCTTCKKEFNIPSAKWGYIGVLQTTDVTNTTN